MRASVRRSGSKMDIPGTARGGTRSRLLQPLGVTFTRMGGSGGGGRHGSLGAAESLSPPLLSRYPVQCRTCLPA